MAFSHLSQADCDKYDIYLSNTKIEDNLEETDNFSSAGHWENLLDQSIDLSNLLFMKSTTAEIALTKMTFDGLPLTYLESENISINLQIPEPSAFCNQYYSGVYLKKMNSDALQIPLDDFMTADPQTAVDYLNDKIALPMFHFILQRYLKLVFDTEIFKKDSIMTPLSLGDIRLLIRYIDCALVNRHIIHLWLCRNTGITNTLNGADFAPLAKEKINLTMETKLLKQSQSLRLVTERPSTTDDNKIDLKLFYGLTVTDVYDNAEQPGSPRNTIEKKTQDWLDFMELISRKDPHDLNSPLTETSMGDCQKIITANGDLLKIGLKARDILVAYRDKILSPKEGSLNDHFFAIVINKLTNKCSFLLNPNDFLQGDVRHLVADTKKTLTISISIIFPEQASYVLGVKDGQKLHIGPIDFDMKATASPKLTNQILATNQTTDSLIRPMSKVIYLATDLVSSLSRDLWLSDTKYASYHLIYCHVIDDNTISSKFICKDNDDKNFFKVNSLKNILNRFNILVLDHNFRKVIFPKKTYVKLALTVQPTRSDD